MPKRSPQGWVNGVTEKVASFPQWRQNNRPNLIVRHKVVRHFSSRMVTQTILNLA